MKHVTDIASGRKQMNQDYECGCRRSMGRILPCKNHERMVEWTKLDHAALLIAWIILFEGLVLSIFIIVSWWLPPQLFLDNLLIGMTMAFISLTISMLYMGTTKTLPEFPFNILLEQLSKSKVKRMKKNQSTLSRSGT